MPTPVQQQVRDAIIAEIAKVPGIGYTGLLRRMWDTQARFPAAPIVEEPLEKERFPTQSKTAHARFRVPVLIKGSQEPENDFLELAANIEDQIEDDPRLGGLTLDCWVSGYGSFGTAPEIAEDVYVRNVFIDAEYRHPRAQA